MPKKQPTTYSLMQINKDKIKQFTPKFWKLLNELADSDNPQDRKFAVSEFNKVILKLLPTQLTGEGGSDIKLAVINYGDKDSNTVQLQTKVLSTPTPTGDGQRVS